MKIIHIVENLDKGAVENWLVNIFIESRKVKPEWKWTFYCILGKKGKLDNIVKEAGGEIIYAPVTVSEKIKFLKHLRSTLKDGKYDVIHSHHDYLSGFYLLATAGISFKKRLLHVHNTDKILPIGNTVLQKILLAPFRTLGLLMSDMVVGISENTLDEFAGKGWKQNGKFRLLYYGVDFRKFEGEVDDIEMKSNLRISSTSKILLFVGRMNDLKNPVYTVNILHELLKKGKDVYALFVGKGDQERSIEDKATALGIVDRIRLIGWQDNIGDIMKSADIFVFPRKDYPKEGLGLVVIEAQAAGLPLFITKGIVEDAIVIRELTFYNNLGDLNSWVNEISELLDNGVPIPRKQCLELMKASKFELNTATRNLLQLYEV